MRVRRFREWRRCRNDLMGFESPSAIESGFDLMFNGLADSSRMEHSAYRKWLPPYSHRPLNRPILRSSSVHSALRVIGGMRPSLIGWWSLRPSSLAFWAWRVHEVRMGLASPCPIGPVWNRLRSGGGIVSTRSRKRPGRKSGMRTILFGSPRCSERIEPLRRLPGSLDLKRCPTKVERSEVSEPLGRKEFGVQWSFCWNGMNGCG